MKFSHALKSALSAAALGFLALGLASTPAYAASPANANLSIGVSVTATCIVSTNGLTFPSYTGSMVSATGAVLVSCTNGTSYSVALNAGMGSGATMAVRVMTGSGTAAGSTINYALSSSSSMSPIWGDGTNGSSAVSTQTGSGSQQSLTVNGQIPAGQYPTPGPYADTVVATVSY